MDTRLIHTLQRDVGWRPGDAVHEQSLALPAPARDTARPVRTHDYLSTKTITARL